MARTHTGSAWVAVLVACVALVGTGRAAAQSEEQTLVNKAEATMSRFLRDPDMTWLQDNIGRAKAVLIAPEVGKAGFIIGGSGGRAVLVAKEGGKWAGPAFYTLATASVGLQAGVSVSETVTLVMTDKGLNALMAPSVRLGGDASIAAGPVGAGAKSDLVADFVTFSRSKGVYGGLNLDGTVVTIADKFNRAYYGKAASPTDILVRHAVSNRQAGKLLGTVGRTGKR
jgi:lipid-binding SYLF domain-containing protein